MAKTYTAIDDGLRAFIESQHVFFVGTAPSGRDGHVNLSPKGIDALRVLDANTVAYADYIGSGVETIAHLRENGRIVIMLCAFEGPPKILRLHGTGSVVEPTDSVFADLAGQLGHTADEHGLRSIIRVAVDRVSDSCGYGVPQYTYEGQRSQLTAWAGHRTPEELRDYQRRSNRASLDGLPGLRWPVEEG